MQGTTKRIHWSKGFLLENILGSGFKGYVSAIFFQHRREAGKHALPKYGDALHDTGCVIVIQILLIISFSSR